MPSPSSRPSRRRQATRLALVAALLASAVGLLLSGCRDDNTVDGTATPEPGASGTTEPTSPSPGSGTGATGAEGTPAASATPSADERLRTHLLSGLTTQADPAQVRAALDQIEVVSEQFSTGERNLWIAVTSGSGIWDLPDEQTHVAAVYELRPNQTWVEVSSLPLASAPTIADIETVPQAIADAQWFAIHGYTGAHSGTFELLRFDGIELTSSLWWFSPSPGAGSLVDLNTDGTPEVVLDATDPYVFCYACSVRLWGEVIYRWDGDDLREVSIAPVPHENQLVTDLTEQAAIFARADLWRRASEASFLAIQEAPGDDEVEWLHLAISRMSDVRLTEAGSPAQPLLTWVLAGEYDAAVALMKQHTPEEVFSVTGPLIAGTAAEGGWEEVTGDYLVDFSTRAIEVDPTLAAAYATRALGHILANPEDWASALADMEEAATLAPGDAFYREARDYLLERNGGAFG